MRKFLSLTKTLLKSGGLYAMDGTTKQWRKIVLYVFLAICMLPTLALVFFGFLEGFRFLSLLDQAGYIMNIGILAAAFVIFLFSMFAIPSVYYFSRDIDHLLVMPLKPQLILAAKFAVCVIYEYLFTAAILLPLYIAYVLVFGFSILPLIAFLVLFFTLPVFPLVISSVLTMLIMRFVPFFNNRDRFNLIGGVLLIVFALGLSVWSNSLNSADMESIVMSLLAGDNSLMQYGMVLFPFVPSAALACFHGDLLQLLVYLAITAAALLVFLLCGGVLYFKGAIGSSETSASRHAFSKKQLQSSSHRPIFFTYLLKEIRLLFRTPVYFMNCILTGLIMPVLLIVIFFTSASDLQLSAVLTPQLIHSLPNLWCYVLLASFAVGGFMGNINAISCTAISREGANAYFMKYIPVPLQTQILAKCGSGILISALTAWLLLIPLHLLLSYSFLYDLLFIGGSLVSIVMSNLFGILIDLLHPKLVWEQEAAAVKQNLTAFVCIMLSFLLVFLFGAPLFLWPKAIPTLAIILLIVQLLLSAVLYFSIRKAGVKLMKQI